MNVFLQTPSGINLVNQGAGNQIDFITLPESGTYDLAIYGSNGATGGYGFALYQPALPITPLTLGSPVTGTLANPGDQGEYTFTGTAGERLFYHATQAVAGGINVALNSPSGTNLVNQDAGNQIDFITLPESGTYVLSIYASNGATGGYGFALYQPALPITPLTLGSPVTGTLANPGDQGEYTFTGTAGERLFYHATQAVAGGINVALNSPSGTNLVNQDAGNQIDFITLPESGTYVLSIYASNGATGGYGFALYHPALPITPLTLGSPVTGTLANPGDQGEYAFTGTAGERLFYHATQAVAGGINVALDTPSNVNLINQNAGNQIGVITLPEAGAYDLGIYASNGATGTYGFDLFQAALPITALALGTPVTATLANPGDAAVYTFAGSAGQRITYDALLSNSSQINVVVQSPSGAQLINQNAASDTGFTLPADGTYSLTIYGNGGATGSASFQLLDASSSPVAPFGTAVSGTLNPGLSETLYQIVGTAGQVLYFHALGTDSNGHWYLYTGGPSPTYINGTTLNADFQATLPQTSSYYLVLSGQQSSGAPVSYSFQVTTPAPIAKPLSLGTTIQGTIDQLGQTVTYSFLGHVGQRLVYDALQSGSPNIRAVLTSPSGLNVFNIDIDQNDGPLTLAEAGLYTLTIEPGLGAGGPYAFQLQDTSTAPALTLGTTISGTLTPGLADNLYQYSGTAGQRLNFLSLQTASGTWGLYGPANQLIASSGSLSSGFVANLPVAGTYVLVIQGSSTTGPVNYEFQATDVSDTSVTPSGFGTVESGTIAAGQTVPYSFMAPAGLPILFNGLSVTGSLTAVLRDPSGNTVFSVSPGSDAGPYILQRSGNYVLTVEGINSSATGSYQFQMIDLKDGSTPLSFATPTSGSLGAGTGAVAYSFTVPVGEQVVYDALSNASTRVVAALYSAGGRQVFYVDANSDNAPGPLLDGSYTLILQATVPGGSYSFQLLEAGTAPAVPLDGTPVTSTLNPGVSATLFTVQGNAGDLVYLHPLNSPGSGTWYLYGPGGQTLAVAGIGSNLSATLPATGTYVLAIYGGNTSGPISYQFTADIANIVTVPIPSSTEPTGATTYTYDPKFNVVTKETDPLGHQTLYQIDPANGNVLTMTRVVGSGGSNNVVTQYTYDSHGLVTKMIDPNGVETDYTYDQYERLIKVTYAVGTPDQASQQYQYDAAGNSDVGHRRGQEHDHLYLQLDDNLLMSTTDPLENTTTYTYDAMGNLLTTTDALKHVTTYTYDPYGNVTETIDANGGITRNTYDADGNLTSTTDPLGNVTRYALRRPWPPDEYDRRRRRRHAPDLRPQQQRDRRDRPGRQPHPVRLRCPRPTDPRDRPARQRDRLCL